jgi:hypothetical protein
MQDFLGRPVSPQALLEQLHRLKPLSSQHPVMTPATRLSLGADNALTRDARALQQQTTADLYRVPDNSTPPH